MTARHLSATPGPAEAIAATFAACVPHLETERTRLRAPNARSLALARRLGAADETPADWDDADVRVFRHRNPGART